MRWSGRGARSAAFAIVAALWAAPATAVDQDESRVSPYLLIDGPRDFAQRAERHRALAVAAAAKGDRPRQARHAAMSCAWHSALTLDASLTAPPCTEARRLAKSLRLLDVELQLEDARATAIFVRFEYAKAYPLLAAIVARGAALDEGTAEAHPVRHARLLLGIVLTGTARYGDAAATFEAVRVQSRRSGDMEMLAYAEEWDCWNELQQGELGRARAACDRTRALLAESGDFFLDINLAFIEGELLNTEGDTPAALASYQRALALSVRPGGELRAPTIRSVIASSLVALGRVDEGRAALEAIDRDVKAGRFPLTWVPLVEHQWGKLERASHRPAEAAPHFAAASRSSESHVSIWALRGLAGARRETGDLTGARAALEEALRRIEGARTSVAGAEGRAAYAENHAAVYRDLVGVRWDQEGPSAAAAALDLAEAGKARALLDALAEAQVIGATAPTLTATAVQARLRPDEVLVEYVSAEDRLFAITVTRDRIDLRPLPGAGKAETLAQRVAFFSALVQERDDGALDAAARRLYDDLLAPALTGIGPDVRTLIVAADGPLHRLPFDAIGEAPRVIARWDVVTLPSASALANHVQRAARSAAALVVAAPANAGGFAPLPAAPAEAKAVHTRLGGEVAELEGAAATRERLLALGPERFAVLHFASHALVDEARPLRSALVLAPSAPGGDGRWTAEDIYRTRLGADLVVLSACGTAAGEETTGEGVMSLSRAFLYAGAGATIATLWDVPDAPGPVFADVLYRELGAGRPLGAAAAEARRELRRQGAPPRAWAAYALTGNPGARVGVTARVARWAGVARAAGLLAIVLLAAAAVLRLARVRWRFSWPAPALAGASLAVLAVILFPWPARYPRLDGDAQGSRGGTESALTPSIDGGRLRWSAVAGAGEHVVEVYDGSGTPIAAPVAATSPYLLPGTAAGWVRVEARTHGRVVARSALIPLP